MSIQGELDFSTHVTRGTGKAPRVDAVEIARVKAALSGRGWVKRSVLGPELGLDLRQLRAVVSAAEPQILSGQRGYCLLAEASAKDLAVASGQWISQGRALIRKGLALRTAGHRVISPA